jgi:hypothetical protein
MRGANIFQGRGLCIVRLVILLAKHSAEIFWAASPGTPQGPEEFDLAVRSKEDQQRSTRRRPKLKYAAVEAVAICNVFRFGV